MIKIISNPYQMDVADLPEDVRVLESVSDYAPVLWALRSSTHSSSPMTVHVCQPLLCRWLKDYLKGYREVVFEEVEPMALLRGHWGTTALPPGLHSQTILELKLLKKPPPKSLEDIKGYVLGQSLGVCWEARQPSWEHVAKLAAWYLQQENSPKLPSSIRHWLEERQTLWCQNASDKLKKTYEWLFEKPMARSELLARLEVLSSYPRDVQQEWCSDLEERYLPTFVSVDQLPQIALSKQVAEALSCRAKIHWKNHLPEFASVSEALRGMSGRLLGEAQAIYLYLLDHMDECNQALIAQLRQLFKSVPEATVLIEQLGAISPKAPMPRAPDPQRNWGWCEWSEWATQEYLPYRAWIQQIGISERAVDKYAEDFGDWLFSHYPTLKHEANTPLIYGTSKRILEVLNDGYIVLWVIADNLDWQHGMYLVKYMAQEGLFLSSNPEPKLSLLPSETSTSKRALIGARLPCDLPEALDYEGLLCNKWGDDVAEFGRNEPTLTRLTAEEATLYVYMYDELDRLAHGHWVDRESLIQHDLTWLASKIKEAATILATKGKVKVIVNSDHGSVKLSSNATKAAKPAYAELDEEHARFAVVSDAKHLAREQWYFLEKIEFGLRENYAVPKGYTYIEAKPIGLTHGGLTPEETIIPHLEFGLEPQPWAPLMLAYRGTPLRLGREEKIRLVLINRNAVSLSKVRIQFPSQGCETELHRVAPESDSFTQELSIYLPPKIPVSASDEVILQAIISFNVYGATQSEDAPIRLPVLRMWREATEADLFGRST